MEKIIGSENTYILTAPAQSGNCYKGKFEWVKKYFPQFINQRRFQIGQCKHTTANARSFLIDDSDLNINDYNEYGGSGILFPQEWNSDYTLVDKSLEIVKDKVCEWARKQGI